MTHLTDSQLLTHLHEFDSAQRLCHDVCKLLVSPNMLHFCYAITNTLSDEMISCVNVLASIMEDGILALGKWQKCSCLNQELVFHGQNKHIDT